MYPLVESVRIENRQLHHVELHNQRINRARSIVFDQNKHIDIGQIVQLPDNLTNERYKCRLVFYRDRVDYAFTSYIQREIKTLKVVTDNTIDYAFKSENRLQLDTAFEHRGECDDIMIVKNDMITDSWAANIILFDGDQWITPNTPLLKGIQREYLLQKGMIREREVSTVDLINYERVRLINAMIDFERAPEIFVEEGIFF